MDKEEFQAWKDSPATQWVLAYFREVEQRMDQALKERLSQSSSYSPAEWAELQPRAAHDLGYLVAVREFIAVEHHDIAEEEKIDA